MDPPGGNNEPAELDHTPLDFDPDSLLDAWVEDLLAAGDHSAQQDDRPAAMPPGNIFSSINTSFGGNESALATDFGMTPWAESIGYIAAHDYIADPLEHFQASEMPQDCVPGLGPSTTNLSGADVFSMFDSSMLQQPYPMDFQFSAGGGHNPPSDVAIQDLSFSSCTNSRDLQEAAANISSDVVFPRRNSMLLGSSDFIPQTQDSRTTGHIEHFEGQRTNIPGASQHSAPTSFTPLGIFPQRLGPDILTRRQLPPKRRGGRRRKLSPEQARQQRETRLSGACIRCRSYNLRCGGGIPCAPCLKILGKSRIWTTPCTKAQFLDIIEAGSSFPSVTMQEITISKSPDISSVMMLMVRLTHISQQSADQCAVIQSIPFGQKCLIPWAVGTLVLLSIFADPSQHPRNWTRPSFWKAASKLVDLAKKYPSGELAKLFDDTEELHTPEWTGSVMAFCISSSYRIPTQYTCDDASPQVPGHDTESLTSSLVFCTGWVASRYLELCLFRHLQLLSNDTSFDSVEDQKSYIMCILTVLLASNSYPQSIHKDSMDEEDPRIVPLYRDVFDRRSRVRSALWVYCSITIRRLPAWSNIWETIEKRWPLVRGEAMAERFQNSLTDFNDNVIENCKSACDSLRRFNAYGSLLSAMDPDFEEEVEDETEREFILPDDRDPEFHRLLVTDGLDNWIEVHDQRTTGGVLSAQTNSQKRVASTRTFAALATVDWRRKTVLPRDSLDPVEGDLDLLGSFVHLVFERLASMQSYDECAALCPAGTPVEEFVVSDTTNEGSNQAMQAFNHLFQRFIRSGRRWNELKDMVGLEVVLMHDPLKEFRSDVKTFYIPSIVEDGSERQFMRLKEIIPTRLQWLTDTCAKLRGLVSKLMAASMTEQENATAIQDGIQTMVTAAFGTRLSVEEALLNSWAQQDDFQRGLIEFLRPEAATIPLDMKVGMSLYLLGKLIIKVSGKSSTCIDFEMKEDVCREVESIMERDCSTLDSKSRKELRVWSHKVLDFGLSWFRVDTDPQASG